MSTNEKKDLGAVAGSGGCVGQIERPLKDACDGLRASIQVSAKMVKSLLDHGDFSSEQRYPGQHGEMKANIMLAYRHLEDARMRIGKILQAADDGVSILDK